MTIFGNIDIKQNNHKVAQQFVLNAAESSQVTLLQIYYRVCQWNNVDNWSALGKVLGKSTVVPL